MTGDPLSPGLPSGAAEGAMTIECAGKRRDLAQSDILTFGRAADLIVDEENPYLHRVVGRFFWHEGKWWVENLGSFIEIEVVRPGDLSPAIQLGPQQPDGGPSAQALTPPGFQLRFESNGTIYEILGEISGDAPAPAFPFAAGADLAGPAEPAVPAEAGPASPFGPPPAAPAGPEPLPPFAADIPPSSGAPSLPDAPAAFDPVPAAGVGGSERGRELGAGGEVSLAVEEKQVLVLLAEPYWRDRASSATLLADDAELAGRLGWSERKVNRKVAYLCNRLTRAGVAGLHGPQRRFALARHAVEAGMVTGADVA